MQYDVWLSELYDIVSLRRLWRTMGLNNGEVNKNGNSHHDPDDEKTPFTEKEEVNGNDIQTDKRESPHNSVAPRAEEDEGILKKLKRDAIYREKYWISIGIMWSFFVLVS